MVGRQVGPICIDHELVAFCRSLKSIFRCILLCCQKLFFNMVPMKPLLGDGVKGCKNNKPEHPFDHFKCTNMRLNYRRLPLGSQQPIQTILAKKMNFTSFTAHVPVRVQNNALRVEITSWSKVKTCKNTCNCRYFQIYEHFTPKILFGFGSHVHLKTIPHGPHIF